MGWGKGLGRHGVVGGVLHDGRVAQVALGWLIQYHQGAVVTVAGGSKPAQIEDNAKALRLVLEPAELKEIDELSKACH